MGKRLFDIVVSLTGLLLLLPLLLLVALAIRLTSRGPAIFTQTRVGLDGRPFRLVKFRTMVRDAPSQGAPITVEGDARITPIGRWLRHSKIDELPQLFNVLCGTMSLVGPRPEIPLFVERYDQTQRRVLSVRPGITDYASIAFFNENSLLARAPDFESTYVNEILPRKLALNLRYLERQSFLEDLRIILTTLHLAFEWFFNRLGNPGRVFADGVIIAASFLLAYQLRFEWALPEPSFKQMIVLLPYTVAAQVLVNYLFGVYKVLWRYISVYDTVRFVKAIGFLCTIMLLVRLFGPVDNPYYMIPISIIVILGLLEFLGMVGIRYFRRWLFETTGVSALPGVTEAEPVIVVGAGNSGHLVAREVRQHPELNMTVVGFVDDDPSKQGTEYDGIKVLGGIGDLARLHRTRPFSQVILAISDLPLQKKRQIVETCVAFGVKTRVLPGTADLLSGKAQVAAVRDVRIEDLLGRPVRELTRDDPLLCPVYHGKRVLISGAGGSIGSELCRQLAMLAPASLTLVDQDENNLFHIRGELVNGHPGLVVHPHILDVRVHDKLERLFRAARPEVVIHAAAYKHVPLMEENPAEAIENNVMGSLHMARLAREHDADTFIMLSTDKAVHPTSVMGATKRVAELIVTHLAADSRRTRYASVRFGNVLGSRGSVIPTFRDQIQKGGPVTVTHPEVTRYFMTIPEASQLVLKAGTLGQRGEVFVLDMGQPICIVDLARDMIRLSGFREGEIPIRFIGLRKGEKLFEEILLDADRVVPTPVDKVFVSRPELRDFTAFMDQVDTLLERARTADLATIRSLLTDMDLGLRNPDAPGPEA